MSTTEKLIIVTMTVIFLISITVSCANSEEASANSAEEISLSPLENIPTTAQGKTDTPSPFQQFENIQPAEFGIQGDSVNDLFIPMAYITIS